MPQGNVPGNPLVRSPNGPDFSTGHAIEQPVIVPLPQTAPSIPLCRSPAFDTIPELQYHHSLLYYRLTASRHCVKSRNCPHSEIGKLVCNNLLSKTLAIFTPLVPTVLHPNLAGPSIRSILPDDASYSRARRRAAIWFRSSGSGCVRKHAPRQFRVDLVVRQCQRPIMGALTALTWPVLVSPAVSIL